MDRLNQEPGQRHLNRMRVLKPLLAFVPVLALAACGEEGAPEVPETAFGHCIYTNRFSNLEECREFRGTGWTAEDAQASCDEYDVELVLGACPYDETQGNCVLDGEPDKLIQLVIPGDDPERCAGNERGCELFGGGTFVPGSTCGGDNVPDLDDAYDPDNYYVPEALVCQEPVDGEPAGQGPDGQVCTRSQMSACTEPGRSFEDYASCEDVRTQRPYAPVPPNDTQPANDPRMNDPTYVAELEWVKAELEACACVCCHKTSITPEGASIWDTEFPGNFANSFTDWGVGFAARAFDSSLLGSYQAEENNGFSRFVAGLPSTDEERMKRFWEGELTNRGLTVADFAEELPAPGVFYEQAIYEPRACENGEGVDAEGVIRWEGGRARYLYVLEATAENPGVPPNLDEPEGTLWKVDTVPPAIPMKTGEVTYGVLPEGTKLAVPEEGAPSALVDGETYLIFAMADIGVPVTRCTFTYSE